MLLQNDTIFELPELEPLQLSAGGDGLEFWKELAYEGDFVKHGEYSFKLSKEVLKHFENNFKGFKEEGIDVPVPKEHSEDLDDRRGTILELQQRKNAKGKEAIFGLVRFKDLAAAEAAKTTNVSIYVPPKFVSGSGKEYVYPITHVALTDYPVIPGLEKFKPLVASFVKPDKKGNEKMSIDIKALLTKLGVDENTPEAEMQAKVDAALDTLFEKAKQPEKKDEPVAIAAGFIKLANKTRVNEIDALVTSRKITPAVATELKKNFCEEAALKLSLKADGSATDGFDNIVAALKLNGEAFSAGEKTGGQGLKLSHADVLDDSKNPMLKVARARAAKAKRK